jgi:NAD(P)-dependent dehydrogenase (short-subunit alcohol dehydrogenase family)
MNVNFMGVLYGVRAFVPRMIAGGQEGHIVNTASVAGLLSGANPYNVSKHAVACLTEGLYKDLKSINSKVSASVLCPGLIRTDILDAERNRPAEYGLRMACPSGPSIFLQSFGAHWNWGMSLRRWRTRLPRPFLAITTM